MRTRLLVLPAIFIVTSLASTPVAAEKLKDWGQTAVRYFMTDGERNTWDELGDDSERQQFVTDFWKRRDPTPGTEANEARDELERRVEDANRLFRSEGGKGWRTDRGRIYLLFGPPDEVREDAAGTIGGGRASIAGGGLGGGGINENRSVTRGSVTWTYHRPSNPDLPANWQLDFRADARGKYVLTARVDPSWGQFSSIGRNPGQSASTTAIAAVETPPQVARASDPPSSRGTAQIIAALSAALDGAVAERIELEAVGLSFPVGRDKSYVVVAFTLGLGSEGPEALEMAFGAFDDEGKLSHAANMPFTAEAGEFDEARSFGTLLEPGRYRLAVVVYDRTTQQPLASRAIALDVADFDDGELHLSSALLTTRIEVLNSGRTNVDEIVDGIVIGNLLVHALPGNRVDSDSTPELVFFIAGATHGEAGKLALHADFVVRDDERETLAIRKQPLAGAVTAQPLPLVGLVDGAHRLQLTVTDDAKARTVSSIVAFTIE